LTRVDLRSLIARDSRPMRAAGVVSRERRDENETRKHAVDFFGLERRVRGSTDLSAAEQIGWGQLNPIGCA
jgi:hypothetical protein